MGTIKDKNFFFNSAIIMAAGRGLRLKELTINLPKALIDCNGIPLVFYSLRQLQQKVNLLFITVGHQKSKLIYYLSDKKKCRIIDTSNKGNSWWIFHSSLKYLNEPVLVLTCDIITYLDLSFIYLNYVKFGFPPCMIVPVRSVEGIDGDYIKVKDNKATALSRTKYSSIYGSGIQVINPFQINKILSCYDDFGQLWIELLRKELLFVSDLYPHPWFSVNTKEQLVNYLQLKNYSKSKV
jgi:N-acetyl-alpha-D-muramate 1-phosphate uridylyltransferase